jgi:hypothetical protein
MSLAFFSSSGVPILIGDNEGMSEEWFFIEKEVFKTGGSPASKSTGITVPEARGMRIRWQKGAKNTLVSAPKGDPNLVSTTMRSAEGSGAVIRHSNDTFQRGLWATSRQTLANWFAGQHSKPMSSFFGLCTLHIQNFSSIASAACPPTRALQATGLPRLTEWMVWDQGGHPVIQISLCLTYCRTVLRRSSWGGGT